MTARVWSQDYEREALYRGPRVQIQGRSVTCIVLISLLREGNSKSGKRHTSQGSEDNLSKSAGVYLFPNLGRHTMKFMCLFSFYFSSSHAILINRFLNDFTKNQLITRTQPKLINYCNYMKSKKELWGLSSWASPFFHLSPKWLSINVLHSGVQKHKRRFSLL